MSLLTRSYCLKRKYIAGVMRDRHIFYGRVRGHQLGGNSVSWVLLWMGVDYKATQRDSTRYIIGATPAI